MASNGLYFWVFISVFNDFGCLHGLIGQLSLYKEWRPCVLTFLGPVLVICNVLCKGQPTNGVGSRSVERVRMFATKTPKWPFLFDLVG